jgi:hypothetical protein
MTAGGRRRVSIILPLPKGQLAMKASEVDGPDLVDVHLTFPLRHVNCPRHRSIPASRPAWQGLALCALPYDGARGPGERAGAYGYPVASWRHSYPCGSDKDKI